MANTTRLLRSITGRTGTPRTSSRASRGGLPRTPPGMAHSTWKASAAEADVHTPFCPGLLAGAVVAVAFAGRLPHRVIAAIMGFGGGVLIAVLSVDLMDSAFDDGGPVVATAGFLFGATAFSAINWRLAQSGARHRNR